MSQAVGDEPISSVLIDKVLAQAQATASHSWEYSVVFEALLEYHNPSLTVFHAPISRIETNLSDLNEEVYALKYIKPYIRTDETTLCEGHGSSADPASLGIAALLLNPTSLDSTYLTAARRQIDHLLATVPRLPNGAISHREATVSAWADFVYMVPPFLAYYGVSHDVEDMVQEAVHQCQLYCEILGKEKGLWKHIVRVGANAPGEREDDDEGLWSTSNGWAAAGMARVFASVRGSKFVDKLFGEQQSLLDMIKGIVCGAIDHDTATVGLLRNYLNNETWWGDVAGTSLLAATAFRMAVLAPDIFGNRYTEWALQKMDTVVRSIDTDTGIAAPVVNPLKETQKNPLDGPSPEGQAFVVLMYVAWRDWKAWASAARAIHSM